MSFQQDTLQNDLTAEQILAEAITHHQAGRLREAEQLYHAVINTAPHQATACYRLGMLCIQDGRSEQAMPFLENALKMQPQNPGILNALGAALQSTGREQEAVTCFRQALAISPNNAALLGNLGKALREQGLTQNAIECYAKIAQLNPHRIDVYIEIGRCYFEKSNFQEAASYFEKALHQNPDYVDALSALAIALWAMGRSIEARKHLEHALQIAPSDAKVVLNFGEFLAFDEGKMDDALGYFNRALSLAPEYISAAWRKSFALLTRGEYREGWRLYAACLGDNETRGRNRFAPMKPWDGKAAPDKHLLIWCEQGLGDSLQFIRYAELCQTRVGKVSVFCQKPLVRLFKELPYIDNASDTCERGSFDEHVPIMNLPHLFDTLLETIPATIPYLHINPEIKAKWASKFADATHDLKVGLVWAGGAHEESVIGQLTDRQRSIGLERMKPLLDIQGIKFYSLQKDKAAEQITALELTHCLTDFMGDVADFADTAEIIHNLDLVITVDTSVAHLTGGLGKPVWIMSRYNADWRWLQNRQNNPWYPTARIFGQMAMGDWNSVITDVKHELQCAVSRKLPQ